MNMHVQRDDRRLTFIGENTPESNTYLKGIKEDDSLVLLDGVKMYNDTRDGLPTLVLECDNCSPREWGLVLYTLMNDHDVVVE